LITTSIMSASDDCCLKLVERESALVVDHDQ